MILLQQIGIRLGHLEERLLDMSAFNLFLYLGKVSDSIASNGNETAVHITTNGTISSSQSQYMRSRMDLVCYYQSPLM